MDAGGRLGTRDNGFQAKLKVVTWHEHPLNLLTAHGEVQHASIQLEVFCHVSQVHLNIRGHCVAWTAHDLGTC